MTTWILLLRGINVGSTRSLPMKELMEILESLGLEDVRTYIQSGNVVFRAPRELSPGLAEAIGEAIEERRGFRPHVLLLSAERLERAAAANPFPDAEDRPGTLHLVFLAAPPTKPDLDAMNEVKAASERFHLADDVLYLHTPDGFGTSKLAGKAEKLLGVEATARNWRTVQKLLEMAR